MTGRVDLGAVVFGDARTRVAAVAATVGSGVASGAELVTLGTETRIGSFEVPPADAATLTIGDQVAIELPDRTTVGGTVSGIMSAADTWAVSVALDPVELPVLDVIDVTMSWQRVVVADPLTIPSSALLRLDDGTYVVDVVAGDSTAAPPRRDRPGRWYPSGDHLRPRSKEKPSSRCECRMGSDPIRDCVVRRRCLSPDGV